VPKETGKMYINKENYFLIMKELQPTGATLVAVSKIKPAAAILELYELGHRDFGENYVQELVEKKEALPLDIRWHFIGHLQTNKVKYIASFVHLIHGVDSLKLLKEINKQAAKNNRVQDVLLQVHIAKEETKFGFGDSELLDAGLIKELKALQNIQVKGLMGMASFSDDEEVVRSEFQTLKSLFDRFRSLLAAPVNPDILSMGMSGDYRIALEEGSTMIRIGSSIFGSRTTR
jgi:pyridoxal phosphate enzyme (YggS family)